MFCPFEIHLHSRLNNPSWSITCILFKLVCNNIFTDESGLQQHHRRCWENERREERGDEGGCSAGNATAVGGGSAADPRPLPASPRSRAPCISSLACETCGAMQQLQEELRRTHLLGGSEFIPGECWVLRELRFAGRQGAQGCLSFPSTRNL